MRRISRDGEAREFFGGLQGESLRSKRAQLLEALRSDRTLAELASRHKGHPTLITKWKRQASEGMVDFRVEALEAALARHGKPEIFNTDQGSPFTSVAFTQVLKDAGVKISMDGKGRLDGQCFHRAAVAQSQVRVRLSPGLRDRRPGPGRDRRLDRLLQHLKASFGVRWTHPRGGLYWAERAISGACPGDGAGGAGGMKIIMGSHLTNAAKLSNDWGPPL